MLKGVIENIAKELSQCTAKTKLLYGIWFIWNHARELFLSAAHTKKWMYQKIASPLPLKIHFQQACVILQLFLPNCFRK